MISPTDLHPTAEPNFKAFQVFLIYFPKRPVVGTIQILLHFTGFILKFKSNLLVKKSFLLKAAFAMAVLDLISHVHLASFVITLHKQLKYSTFASCIWSTIICIGDGCLEILITLIFFFHNHFQSMAPSNFSQTFRHALYHCFYLSQ